MNPWAFLIIALGIVLIIIGIKGTQHNIAGAIANKTGKSAGNTTTTDATPV